MQLQVFRTKLRNERKLSSTCVSNNLVLLIERKEGLHDVFIHWVSLDVYAFESVLLCRTILWKVSYVYNSVFFYINRLSEYIYKLLSFWAYICVYVFLGKLNQRRFIFNEFQQKNVHEWAFRILIYQTNRIMRL